MTDLPATVKPGTPLQACRKCGSDKADTDKRRKYWFVECLHCGYHTEATDTEAEATDAWNRRTPALAEKAEKLADALQALLYGIGAASLARNSYGAKLRADAAQALAHYRSE